MNGEIIEMENEKALQLVKTDSFEGIEFSLYQKPGDPEFWGTRDQIGQMLGYSEPRIAIGKIHSRNSERLDKFATVTKLVTVEGDREVEREFTIYNFKGLLEICRFSNQPKADAVMDFVWNMADEVRKHGVYVTNAAHMSQIPQTLSEALRLAADLEDKRIALEADLEVAIRTKAQIGSRREAKAMATASIATRTLNKVLDALGGGRNWKQVRAIGWLRDYFDIKRPAFYSVLGKKLKAFSLENGFEVRDVDDTKYGKVCSFDVKAIEAFREYLDECPEVMGNFRVRMISQTLAFDRDYLHSVGGMRAKDFH